MYLFEHFIISDGVILKRVKEVLIEKAKAGIDIRLLIDDFGCLGNQHRRIS